MRNTALLQQRRRGIRRSEEATVSQGDATRFLLPRWGWWWWWWRRRGGRAWSAGAPKPTSSSGERRRCGRRGARTVRTHLLIFVADDCTGGSMGGNPPARAEASGCAPGTGRAGEREGASEGGDGQIRIPGASSLRMPLRSRCLDSQRASAQGQLVAPSRRLPGALQGRPLTPASSCQGLVQSVRASSRSKIEFDPFLPLRSASPMRVLM